MSDLRDSKLEALLRSRTPPPASGDLAARIAREARGIPQRQPLSLVEAVSRLFAELRLPRPAVALSATLLVGLIAGWTAPFVVTEVVDEPEALYVQSFLYPDEDAS
jgi:hypothetical protein